MNDKKPPKNYSIDEFQENQRKKLEEWMEDVENKLELQDMIRSVHYEQKFNAMLHFLYQFQHQMRQEIDQISRNVLNLRNEFFNRLESIQQNMLSFEKSIMQLGYHLREHALEVFNTLEEYAMRQDEFRREMEYQIKEGEQRYRALQGGVEVMLQGQNNRLNSQENMLRSKFLDFRSDIKKLDDRSRDAIIDLEARDRSNALAAQKLLGQLRDAYRSVENSQQLFNYDYEAKMNFLNKKAESMGFQRTIQLLENRNSRLQQGVDQLKFLNSAPYRNAKHEQELEQVRRESELRRENDERIRQARRESEINNAVRSAWEKHCKKIGIDPDKRFKRPTAQAFWEHPYDVFRKEYIKRFFPNG
ncbi:MAG: hypothetical protein AAGG81_00050 [Chlamydiota bacterium]